MEVYLVMANQEDYSRVIAISLDGDPIYRDKAKAEALCEEANVWRGEKQVVKTIYGETLPKFVVETLVIQD